MLNTPLNNTGKTNLVGGLNTKPEMSSSRRHLLNTFNRVLNEYFGILTVIAVIIVLALSYNFILRPKYQKILEKINTNAFAAKQLEPKYQELTNYEKLAEAYSQLDPKILEKHAGLVPPEYIKEDLFAEVIYLFSHNGYEVKTLDVTREGEGTEVATSTNGRKASPAKTSDTGSLPVGIGMMRVSVSVANIDYPHLKKLLGLIEHNLRLTDVQDLSFNPAEKTAALHLSTYYFKK